MKEKEFGNIYSLGEDLDERFAWCVQLIDNELCIAIPVSYTHLTLPTILRV